MNIFHTTEPLIIEDWEREDPIQALTRDDERLIPLIREKERIGMRHTQMHMLGLEGSRAHAMLLQRWHEVETMLNQCWISPLN